MIEGFGRAQAAVTAEETAALVREHGLPREALKPEHLTSPEVWAALLEDMPMAALKRSATVTSFDPLTLLPVLAMSTEHLGLIATASTTFEPPYAIARRFASLDHISDGRAGWNLVTTSNPDAALNFGMDEQMEHAERYARAREFYDVVTGLWDSWADDAFIRDVDSGVFFEPDKMHTLNHKGEFLSVKGPLNIARPVQGWPVIVQAGASDAGRRLAAETAEAVFTAQSDIAAGRAFYADVKGRMEKLGRPREHMKILPACFVVVGETVEAAREKRARGREIARFQRRAGTDQRGKPRRARYLERLVGKLPRLAIATLEQCDQRRILLRAHLVVLRAAAVLAHIARQCGDSRGEPQYAVHERKSGQRQQYECVQRQLDPVRRRDEQHVASVDTREQRDPNRRRCEHQEQQQRTHRRRYRGAAAAGLSGTRGVVRSCVARSVRTASWLCVSSGISAGITTAASCDSVAISVCTGFARVSKY